MLDIDCSTVAADTSSPVQAADNATWKTPDGATYSGQGERFHDVTDVALGTISSALNDNGCRRNRFRLSSGCSMSSMSSVCVAWLVADRILRISTGHRIRRIGPLSLRWWIPSTMWWIRSTLWRIRSTLWRIRSTLWWIPTARSRRIWWIGSSGGRFVGLCVGWRVGRRGSGRLVVAHLRG
jgi:hypothetical protein